MLEQEGLANGSGKEPEKDNCSKVPDKDDGGDAMARGNGPEAQTNDEGHGRPT